MKNKKTLVLAASIRALTLTAFPHVAAAGTGAAPQAVSEIVRKAGGSNLIYVQVIRAVARCCRRSRPKNTALAHPVKHRREGQRKRIRVEDNFYQMRSRLWRI
jgi:hypothetical protein